MRTNEEKDRERERRKREREREASKGSELPPSLLSKKNKKKLSHRPVSYPLGRPKILTKKKSTYKALAFASSL
jgi:hypothetical protein